MLWNEWGHQKELLFDNSEAFWEGLLIGVSYEKGGVNNISEMWKVILKGAEEIKGVAAWVITSG